MDKTVSFIMGFIFAASLWLIFNLPYFRKLYRQRKEEIREHPERKGGTTKVVLFSILITYHIAFLIGAWVVIYRDVSELGTLLTFAGGVTAAAVAFYCWKAKAENLLKIKASNSELAGSLSDFANMS